MSSPSSPDPAPGTVRARVASRIDTVRLARRERFVSALWPVPLLFGVAALVLSRGTVLLDRHDVFGTTLDRVMIRDPETAMTFSSVVASGMLVFLGIVFSTTLVAIQLAGSQYSPRAVRLFLRLRLTKVALGVFVATFVFALSTLTEVRPAQARTHIPSVSLLTLGLLMLATVVVFLVFANGTARLLRVQYLVERIAAEARPSLVAAFAVGGEVEAAVPTGGSAVRVVTAHTPGVLDAVDVETLATIGRDAGGWVEVLVPVGSYVGAGTAVAAVHGTEADRDGAVLDCFVLSNERTMLLDPGFGLRQLVDVASRALSPAVNDPTTAVQVIDRVTDLLGRIAPCPDPPGWYVDDAGTARVRMPVETFDRLVRLGYTEIIRYGADAPQVVRRLRASFDALEPRRGARPSAGLDEVRTLLERASADLLPDAFAAVAAEPDVRGLG